MVAAVLIVSLLLTSAPFVFAYFSAPPDKQFMGVMVNIPDHGQYFAWMRDLARQNLAPNRLTSEPNDPAFFNLLWWSLGRFGALTGLPYDAVFGAFRILSLFSLLGVGWFFFRVAVPDQLQRRLAYLLFAFGGGLGVLWIVVKYLAPSFNLDSIPAWSFDLFTSEPNTFFIMLAFPHFGMALTLIVAMFALTLLALERQQLRYAVAAGAVGFLIGLQHAYDLLTVYSVLGIFGLLVWRRDRVFPMFLFKCGLIIALLTIPPALYLTTLVLTDATWGDKLSQFDNAGAWTPLPWRLPILMGVPLILALLAFRPKMLSSRSNAELFVAVWFLCHFVLIYLPLNFQIHLLLGWQLPIAVLAAGALVKIVWPWLQRRAPQFARPAIAALLFLIVATNLYLVAWRFIDLRRYDEPFYLSSNNIAALRWLETNTTRDDVVLATLDFGQFVPFNTDARAFLAHWAGTLDFFNKRDMSAEVLNPATPPARRAAILQEHGVTYVVVRDREQPAAQLTPAAADTMTPVFQQGDVTIYRVRR